MIRFVFLFVLMALAGCAATPHAPDYTPRDYVQVAHPAWTRDAVIYQINTRQFTPDGTFAAAQAELPRLAEMGVDILWLMPIHPIGEVNRKGPLGSPYAVRDFRAVNPELGTLAEFRAFVDAAHALGMKVIIDWVANHSAWDNPLLDWHPDWYARDWRGEVHPPLGTDWADVIEFDYASAGLRQYMTESLLYWVRETGVDGFRCDVAGLVPTDFWETARAELDKVKPVFMLAEWETRDLHARAFDATYAWEWKDVMQSIAREEMKAGALWGYYYGQQASWPEDAYRMVYTANHDQNAWDGAAPDIYGRVYENAVALSFLGEGIPLIYNGQEAFNTDMLEFFDRDPIAWQDHPIKEYFRLLAAMKADISALHNGAAGARMIRVGTSAPEEVFSFTRRDSDGGVLVLLNFSSQEVAARLLEGPFAGSYRNAETGERITLSEGDSLTLAPGARLLLVLADD